MVLGRQAVLVPETGELPELRERENLSSLQPVGYAPAINGLLRLEEKDRRSSEDQVVVPAAKGEREMDELAVSG